MPSQRSKAQENDLLGKIIDLMRSEGLEVTSPYDVENFFMDHGRTGHMFETGRFKDLEEED